jgi:hypothetical protein
MALFAVLIATLCARMVASLIIRSWNQLMEWLKRTETLRELAHGAPMKLASAIGPNHASNR